MKVLVIKLKGLHCGSCLNTIENIAIEHGAKKVDIKLSTMIAHIYHEHLDEYVLEAIESKGYTAEKLAIYDESELS